MADPTNSAAVTATPAVAALTPAPPLPSQQNSQTRQPQPNPIHIHEIRFSIIWNETIPDLLADVPNDKLSFLRRSSTYEPYFASLNVATTGPLVWELPWHHPNKHHYWNNYLERRVSQSLLSVRPAEAWHALVPVRKKLHITAPWLTSDRLLLEAFSYPHGIALIMTAICKGDFSLNEVVDLAFMIRGSDEFTIKWSQNEQETVDAEAIPSTVFTRLRQDYLGSTAAEGISSDPFTVFTVVRGSGVDYSAPVQNGGEIHRMLEAVTRWSPTWHLNPLPDLSQVSTGMRESPASHLLYRQRRGRAVWYPSAFSPESGVTSSLSCYHRNLVFASMQTESLSSLITTVADRLQSGFQLPTGEQLSAAQRACARNASDMLGVIYGAKKHKTYRSFSPRLQIEQNGYTDAINYVRNYFGLGSLHAEP